MMCLTREGASESVVDTETFLSQDLSTASILALARPHPQAGGLSGRLRLRVEAESLLNDGSRSQIDKSDSSRWSATLARVRGALRNRFSLEADRADDADIDARIRADVPIHGTNLWVLVFAIFIASIGLNVDSTAVIIGAMLISPLMGPIMGVGYGIGIRNIALVRRAARTSHSQPLSPWSPPRPILRSVRCGRSIRSCSRAPHPRYGMS